MLHDLVQPEEVGDQ
uniref:Uncharacterized protein n=1 Tax=Arundo donax TaxID=35708 RepID=A0A0A9F153_ARUDO